MTATPTHSPAQAFGGTRHSTATSTETTVSSTSTSLTNTPTATPIAPSTAAASTTPNQSPAATAAAAGSGPALTFTAEADAQVVQASSTTNFGTSTTLQSSGGSGSTQTSLIRFKVTGTHDTIQDVRLRVFCTKGTTAGPAVYLADSNWIESGVDGVTWNNQPELLSGEIDRKSTIGAGAWTEYDVGSLVTGDGMYTFALITNGTDGATFSSREGSAPPQLVVTFVP